MATPRSTTQAGPTARRDGNALTKSPGFIVSAYRGPEFNKIVLVDLANFAKKQFDISDFVVKANINYTSDMASELTFDIVDVDFEFAKRNAFTLGQTVIYETQTIGSIADPNSPIQHVKQIFEIASVSSTQSAGGSVLFSVSCYPKAIQQMRRDRKPGTIKGTGTAFIRNAARKYGLKFYGQETSKGKGVSQSSGSKQAESLWDVMSRIAGDNKYLLFEVDGYLVFGSEKWLLYKWGSHYKTEKVPSKDKTKKEADTVVKRYVPLVFPSTSEYLKLTEYPTLRVSSNDPYAGDGSCLVERLNGTQIRPGMTVYVGDVPQMSGYFLVTSVSFEEMSAQPVSVSFRTPQKDPEKDKIRDLPIGQRYLQTFSEIGVPRRLGNTKTSSKNKTGSALYKPFLADARIRPLPTPENPLNYPRMKKADISQRYGLAVAEYSTIRGHSTLETDKVYLSGNLDLWDRPVLIDGAEAKTLFSTCIVVNGTAPFEVAVLPTIYTENGEPVEKTDDDEIYQRYVDAGGYSGSATYLAIVRGSTKQNALKNARDYASLLSWQQTLVMVFRFENGDPVNTPGGADSEW